MKRKENVIMKFLHQEKRDGGGGMRLMFLQKLIYVYELTSRNFLFHRSFHKISYFLFQCKFKLSVSNNNRSL